MQTRDESEEIEEVELILELKGTPISAEALKADIEGLLDDIRAGVRLELEDDSAAALISNLRDASVPIEVGVSKEEMGTGVVDLLVHIMYSGPVTIVAYDIWKKILLPQLVAKYGRKPFNERQATSSKKTRASKRAKTSK